MEATSSALIDSNSTGKDKVVELMTIAAVLTIAAVAFALLFNRSNVLSHSIGYNLYASERVLEGEVPYRDFHTLYPPATFWLNAILFEWLGVSLHSALLGVLIFKVATVIAIYLGARQLMSRPWSLVAALSSLLWLRPNGPFKSVPMQYGLLFLTLAMLQFLKHERRRRLASLFLSGLCLGLVALFKHNIAAYAILGSLTLLVLTTRGNQAVSGGRQPISGPAHLRLNPGLNRDFRPALILLFGCAAALLPALIYMATNGALGPMIRTLLFGPGEFLSSRLAVPLSPVAPALLIASIAFTAYCSHRLRERLVVSTGLWVSLILAITLFLVGGSEADINQIIFYLPMIVLFGGLLICLLAASITAEERRASLIVFVFSASALMEVFPRFAREQSIAAMPLVMLFLIYLLYRFRFELKSIGGPIQAGLAVAVLPLTFLLIEGRLFFSTYFDGEFRLRATAQAATERARGVYFPSDAAAVIENAVGYIQQEVPVDGNAFAQSDAGTSLLFLANRRNASNAQFWIGVGVSEQERAATLERIDKSRTKLVITSDEVFAAERYEPMRNYIEKHFTPAVRFEDVLMLKR